MSRCILLLLLLTTTCCFAKNNGQAVVQSKNVFQSKKKAGINYELQGEYLGDLADGTWGIQVIAAGNGTFKAIRFKGGLPGAGWSGAKSDYKTGKLNDHSVTVKFADFGVVFRGNSADVFGHDGSSYGSLAKVQRQSKTLGMKPPEGAIVLFDGKGAKKWNHARVYQKKLLASNCWSKAKFGDHQLHIEFRIPFMPGATGQHRGNSGVYVQSRYELQILDSFGLPCKENACGGIYEIAKPKLNMCFPPLAWQTYDIDFSSAKWDGDKKVAPAKITVAHNGELIHEDLVLPKHTPGRHRESPEPDALFLQDHGTPVVFRNVWIVKK